MNTYTKEWPWYQSANGARVRALKIKQVLPGEWGTTLTWEDASYPALLFTRREAKRLAPKVGEYLVLSEELGEYSAAASTFESFFEKEL